MDKYLVNDRPWPSTVAANVRAELMALLTASESLLDGSLEDNPEQLREQLTAIRQGTAWLQRHVENLLSAEALRQGRLHLHLEVTALEDWLRETQPVVRPLLLARKQSLRIVRRGALRPVTMDRRRITQVVMNLIANASDRTDASGGIELSLASRKNGMRVTVADSGPAVRELPPGQGFGAFEQEVPLDQRAEKRAVEGLALSQAIVEQHEGQTGVTNLPGGGAAFWFELPARWSRRGEVRPG
ncbi:MAG TPA: ATP-binding protein [Chloroflexota bacterium]